jgi:hypothetical protein
MARRSYQAEDEADGELDGEYSTEGAEQVEGYGEPRSFFAGREGAWFNRLRSDPNKSVGAPPKAPTNYEGQDEIRWGDSRDYILEVPASGGATSPFAVPQQILQVTRAARLWGAFFSLEFSSFGDPLSAQQATEQLIGAFAVTAMVGSSRTTFDVVAAMTFPVAPNALNPIVTQTSFLNAFPAKQIVITGTVQLLANAFATDRVFRCRLACGVAPYTR